ncbi:MAG: glycosyltransferase, partial [Planctomycetota bacterium]
MKMLLLPWGTLGDVHPYIALGTALRDRGHRVTLIVNEHFEPLARRSALDFLSTGSAEEYDQTWSHPDAWHPRKGRKILAQGACRPIPAQYQAIAEAYEPNNTVVAASCCSLGARIAHEKLGVPLATLVLQPLWFTRPQIPDWLPGLVKDPLYWAIDVYIAKVLGMAVSEFRAQLGLSPRGWLGKDWWLSPQRVIAMFPDWYAAPGPTWPEQTRLTGFPLYDGPTDQALSGEVKSFLAAGDPPIVFTPGSGIMHDRAFFRAATDACRRADLRGILLTRYADQIPECLPEAVRHFD